MRAVAAALIAVTCVALAAPASAQVPDHLKCYKIKDALKVAGTADLNTPQFGVDPGCAVSKAKLFCVPASKTNVAVTDKATGAPITPLPVSAGPADGDRICYRVRCPTPATPIADQSATDQFGNRTLSRFKVSMLCTPAVKGTAFCGDGTISAGEDCDGSNLGGATCQSHGFEAGTLACGANCHFDIGACDCTPSTCGNGSVDGTEQCDGANLNVATCSSLGYSGGGALSCTAGCAFDTTGCGCSVCPSDTCGNGTAEGDEQCDGADLAGESCTGLGYSAGGTLACGPGCGFDTSGCACAPASTCGNAVRDGAEQCDGADLGGATCAGLGYTLGGTLACTAGCGYDTSGCASQAFPATGQTAAYMVDKNDGVPGTVVVLDDGTVQAGATLAYVDNGDGTITDTNTGLMWEKKCDDSGLHDLDNVFRWSGDGTQETIWDWLDDVNSEGGSGFAGHSDWRVPNVRELQSIINYGTVGPAVSPVFNTACAGGCSVLACSCTPSALYWSSTTYKNYVSDGWGVDFPDGQVYRFGKSYALAVRAVRGGS